MPSTRAVPELDMARPPRHGMLLVLDQVGNPHNLGAIARSAAYFGVGAMVLHDTPAQAMPSDAAYRVAEGWLEYLDLYRAPDLAGALRALDRLYRTVAATAGGDGVPARLVSMLVRAVLLVAMTLAGVVRLLALGGVGSPEVVIPWRLLLLVAGAGLGAMSTPHRAAYRSCRPSSSKTPSSSDLNAVMTSRSGALAMQMA